MRKFRKVTRNLGIAVMLRTEKWLTDLGKVARAFCNMAPNVSSGSFNLNLIEVGSAKIFSHTPNLQKKNRS
jgi:hypothetical protein